MTPKASKAISTAAGSTLTSFTNGPLFGFGAAAFLASRVPPEDGLVGCDAAPAWAFEAASAACPALAPCAAPVVLVALARPARPPDGVARLAVERPVGVARLVANVGADCDVAPWDPEPVALGEWGVSTLGVCRTGVGSGGVDGVVTRGVVTDGVLTAGVLTGPTATVGAVTEGTVTAGTLTLGTERVGSLTVGTLTAGTLIVGTDAEAAAGTSSAPQAMRTAIACRRTGGRTSH